MADKKATIVIKKVKKGGHGGHHGGAWKVAYADFVTAMMCFFLVMWLMGADESTKASIAAYFNNPSAPETWRPELTSPDQVPLGNQVGAGESILKGTDGQTPDDLVKQPQSSKGRGPDSTGPTDSLGQLSKEDLTAADSMTFFLSESQLFRQGSEELLSNESLGALLRIKRVARNYHGNLLIRSRYMESTSNEYEFQMSRMIKLKELMIDEHWLAAELIRVSAVRERSEDGETAEDTARPRLYEFTFSK